MGVVMYVCNLLYSTGGSWPHSFYLFIYLSIIYPLYVGMKTVRSLV